MRATEAGYVVMAPAPDRFARDPTDLLVLGRDIQTKGAWFVSITEPIVDTDSEFWQAEADRAPEAGGVAAPRRARRAAPLDHAQLQRQPEHDFEIDAVIP